MHQTNVFSLVGMPPPHREWITIENDNSEDDSGKDKTKKAHVSMHTYILIRQIYRFVL